MSGNEHRSIAWTESGSSHSARWHSEAGVAAPRRVRVADDTLTADAAYRLACEGTALLWRGDFQNARQLLQAMTRRFERGASRPARAGATLTDAFHRHRMLQAQRARTLGMLLIPFEAEHRILLRRAPDVALACTEACGVAQTPYVASLRELLGWISAHEWRKRGVEIAALEARIHAHYGVFSPVRGEYLSLVAQAALPAALGSGGQAFDIGTGTGVLAALLARRGVETIVATELNERALCCARENIARLGMDRQVTVQHADLFPSGRAALIVCNPPWLPGRPASLLEQAVYDPDSRMLRGFIAGLAAHLESGGEGWLILSDLAEHLGLRTRESLLGWFAQAGLTVQGKQDVRPQHPKAADIDDPLHLARVAEVTSLWRLGVSASSAGLPESD